MRFATASVCAGLAMTGCKKLAGYRRRGADTPPNLLFKRQCGGPMGALTSTQGQESVCNWASEASAFMEHRERGAFYSALFPVV